MRFPERFPLRPLAGLPGALFALLALTACGTAQPAHPDPAMSRQSETALPLVFIPGLNGSLLEDSQGRQRWVGVAQGLALSTPDLSLPLQWNNGAQNGDDLRPAGVIMDVSLISGVLGQDFYGPWVDFAQTIDERPLHIFAYDWRRDNNESSAKFEAFLDDLSKRYGGKKLQVVAHSMGGMITLTVLNRRPELFDRVVFAGVPFRGGVGYLPNMHKGIQIGLNGELLKPEVLFSHPSVYSFYPSGQRFENTDVVLDESGERIQLDFYDANTWRTNGFGVFAPDSAEWRGNADDRLAFLQEALRTAKKFRAAMQPRKPAAQYPPVLVVGSKAHDTMQHIRRKSPASMKGNGANGDGVARWDFAGTPAVGDGGVLFRDMLPPEPIRHSVALSQFAHAFLLNDPQMQDRVARFLFADAP